MSYGYGKMKNKMGKGSNRRPRLVSLEEEDLRWKLYQGKITERQFNLRLSKIRSKKCLN